MERVRKPFQGVSNVVRFNWPLYALSLGPAPIFLLLSRFLAGPYRVGAVVACLLVLVPAIVSLLVTFCVYDLSGLYRMDWCGESAACARIVNIHAGFDETSALLQERFPGTELIVFDFYDPARHTEASIERARKTGRPFPGTRSISTGNVPLPDDSVDKIFLTLAAHEIRNRDERIVFFHELKRSLKLAGQIVITEHLRDLPNFLAYTVGFFHFLPRSAWVDTFQQAGLKIAAQVKTTPFITTFILEKHGTAS